MPWITGIKLDNYRAFAECKVIKIPYGQHLLIYGENGSGKSSIYRALHDFFSSTWSAYTTKFTTNVFGERKDGVIELSISSSKDSEDNCFSFAEPKQNSTNSTPVLQLADKLRGFLDYKRILKAHALDVPAQKKPDIFDFLFNDLLNTHRIPSPKGGTSTVEVGSLLNSLSHTLKVYRRNAKYWQEARTQLPLVDTALKDLMKKIFTVANNFLKDYFRNAIHLDVNYTPLELTAKKDLVGKTELRVFYADKEIADYHVFLNEARLSALSICLYLAAVRTKPLPDDSLRVIFLDDVFIGLDTSNRLPLLNILKNEFIANGFQVFISTYDRHFFEVTRNWFATEIIPFKCIELFIGKHSDSTKPDFPVIVDPSHNYFEKAIAHFQSHDYPTAANCLRKECEKQLKRILPCNLRLVPDHTNGTIIEIEKLETLIENFFKFLEGNELDSVPFQHFRTYKKVIFNPLSHDDLNAPHYRSEIEGGIVLVDGLNNILIKDIITFNSSQLRPLKFGARDNSTNKMHLYEFHFKENLRIAKQGANNPVFLQATFELREKNGTSRIFTELHKAFDEIRSTRGYGASTDYTEFYNHVKVTNTKKLIDFMQFT